MTTTTLGTTLGKHAVHQEDEQRNLQTLDVAVLAGGPGSEREVSLDSGRAVGEALARRGHRVQILDIDPSDLSALSADVNLFFVALHGAFGEDGQVQRELTDRGLIYCGSGRKASALAMDKVATKQLLMEHGIPTPEFEVLSKGATTSLEPPCVVKPIDSGSSVDICIAHNADQLCGAAEDVIRKYGCALVENYVKGQELTVGILDGRPLPVCEIRTKREFYNYLAKYVDDDTEYRFEIDLPMDLLRRVQMESVRAAELLGCRDFCRIDWMVDASTNEPYFIEVNTIPGFTSHSLLPKAAGKAGIDFDELCDRIVRMAMTRGVDQAETETDRDES